MSSRSWYRIFIMDIKESFFIKYDEVKYLNENEIELKRVLVRPRTSALISRLREFQFKLLHKILYFNDKLFQIGIKQTNLCSFCRVEEETASHVFFYCQKVKTIWGDLGEQLKIECLSELTWSEVLLGISGGTGKIQFINHIVLLVKYVIFNARNKGKSPTIQDICKLLLENREQEKQIAESRNSLSLHLRKWEHFSYSSN